MKNLLYANYKNFIFLLSLTAFLITDSNAQAVILNGPQSVLPGSKQKYIANFNFDINPNSNITWSVGGGTILSQITNPNSLEIYCVVAWNYTSQGGYITVSESFNNATTTKEIFITNYPSIVDAIVSPLTDGVSIDCTPLPPNQCNSLLNNNFNINPPPPPYNSGNPFGAGNVSHWIRTHGSPQLIDPANQNLQPPSPATGFSYMYAGEPLVPGAAHRGEGIAQKTPFIFSGASYTLSFFIKYCEFPVGSTTQLDEFYVVLANCSDITALPPDDHEVPSIPTNSQIIYLGTGISNQNWQQIQTTFVATGNYDMFWVFPKQISGFAGAAFAYPTLAGTNEVTTISPVGPINICTPWEWAPTFSTQLTASNTPNNQYQWYKDGQLIIGANSQTLQAQHYQQGVNVRTHRYTVANPISGCITPIPVIVNFVPTPLPPIEVYGLLQRGVWQTIQTTQNLAPTTYTWNIPGAVTNDFDITDQFIDVFFPSSLPNSITGQVTINGGASCANGIYPIEILLFPNKSQKERNPLHEDNSKNTTSISPNPVISQTYITSSKPIIMIDIFDPIGRLIRQQYVGRNLKTSLDFSDFKNGIYIIKIHTEHGNNSIKIQVQR